MKLEEMPTKELLALHNRIADKPAGPKTFATRAKLVARIEQIAQGIAQQIDAEHDGDDHEARQQGCVVRRRGDAEMNRLKAEGIEMGLSKADVDRLYTQKANELSKR